VYEYGDSSMPIMQVTWMTKGPQLAMSSLSQDDLFVGDPCYNP